MCFPLIISFYRDKALICDGDNPSFPKIWSHISQRCLYTNHISTAGAKAIKKITLPIKCHQSPRANTAVIALMAFNVNGSYSSFASSERGDLN